MPADGWQRPVEALPRLTADLPGVGGSIKSTPDDFQVEEIPAYAPCGSGTHLYITFEKRGLTTRDAIQRLARVAGRPPREFGYAGLKDARALTRQTVSVEHVDPARLEGLDDPELRILAVDRHTNKLRMGHLHGNRFVVRVRHVADAAARTPPLLERLQRHGVPNYFGSQRFGVTGANADVARAALREDYAAAIDCIVLSEGLHEGPDVHAARTAYRAGDFAAAAARWPRPFVEHQRVCRALARCGGDHRAGWNALDGRQRQFYLSALQSALFNEVVAARIAALGRLETGDLAWKHANGVCFDVTDGTAEQPRADAFEVSPSGPLFGRKMRQPSGCPAAIEAGVLGASDLTDAAFDSPLGRSLDGARRPLRVPLDGVDFDTGLTAGCAWLELRFALPRGSYATSVTAELCRDG